MPLKDHPLRSRIVAEMHLRRMPALPPATQMVQVLRLVDAADRERELNYALGLPGADPRSAHNGMRHVSGAANGVELLWERHSEASTVTAILPDRPIDPFETRPQDEAALDWLAEAPGEVLRAVRIGIVASEAAAAQVAEAMHFVESELVSCRIGGLRIWSDFRVHDDGFGRLLVAAGDVLPADLGRLVQRVQELGNYRNLALLGLPVAQAQALALSRLEAELVDISRRLADGEADKALLDELCGLSAQVAALTDATAFRMAATAAYAQIVQERLAGLDCTCIAGFQNLGDFVERRLLPATRTCASFMARLESLAIRIERASALLRTHVEVVLQSQNAVLLHSMERNSARQLRLQRLVEGLSVAAVSYYVMGLSSYVIKALAHEARISADTMLAWLAPAIVALVWLYLRRQVQHLHRDDAEGGSLERPNGHRASPANSERRDSISRDKTYRE